MAGQVGGRHRRADAEEQELAGQRRQRGVRRSCQRAAEVAQLDGRQRGARVRPGRRHPGVDRRGRQLAEQQVRRAVGQRRRRVHVHPREARGRHRGEGVDLRPQRPQRREELRSLGVRAEQRDLDRREGPTAQLLGELRERRQADHASHRGRGLGRLRGPGVPRVQHLRRALPGEEQRPGVELGHGHEAELERRHDAEVAATALQRPQQVGLVIGVRADPASRRRGRRPPRSPRSRRGRAPCRTSPARRPACSRRRRRRARSRAALRGPARTRGRRRRSTARRRRRGPSAPRRRSPRRAGRSSSAGGRRRRAGPSPTRRGP